MIDGKLVGLTHYLYHRHGWKVENVCYLQDLYADPSVRGMGVGRALIVQHIAKTPFFYPHSYCLAQKHLI